MKYVKFHFGRTVIVSALCLCAAVSLSQSKYPTTEQKLGNPTLQKIIQVREVRDSMDRKNDSLNLKLDRAIAKKNGQNIVKKNKEP